MNNFAFTKNPFSAVNNTKKLDINPSFKQSKYDILGRKTVEEVQDEMNNLHNHMNNIEHKEPQIHVNDLQNDFKHKMDNINDLRRMQ